MKRPRFFPTPDAFRRWFEEHHASAHELWVGFYKKGTGRPSITWPQSVDEALCFGWIDGVRKKIDEERYVIRFTPRSSRSGWSTVNSRRIKQLIKEGRVLPAGLRAFKARDVKKSGVYSFEQRVNPTLDPASEKRFRANKDAWRFFQLQPPGYRRLTTFWVMSARKEETRARRLDRLIADSAAGQRIREFQREPRSQEGK